MHQWTPRTTSRAELAEMLRDRYPKRAHAAGITPGELEAISQHGRDAEQADRIQKRQLATIAAERGAQKDMRTDVFAREDALRDRLPAVLREMWSSGDRHGARWLSNLTFARYRFREIPLAETPAVEASDPCAEDTKEAQLIRSVQRVEKTDVTTRARSLAAFCEALLDEPSIAKRLAERGLPPDQLRDLADDAAKLAEVGSNRLRAAEATAAEAEAAKAQLDVWKSVRRMLRKAVQGVPELEKKWAEC